MADRTERRTKVFFINERDVIACLQGTQHQDMVVPTLATFPALPAGYIIERVWTDPQRQCFGVLVWHESFEVVMDGMESPCMAGYLGMEMHVMRSVEGGGGGETYYRFDGLPGPPVRQQKRSAKEFRDMVLPKYR